MDYKKLLGSVKQSESNSERLTPHFTVTRILSSLLALASLFFAAALPMFAALPALEEQLFIRTGQRIFQVLAVGYAVAFVVEWLPVRRKMPEWFKQKVSVWASWLVEPLLVATFAATLIYLFRPDFFEYIFEVSLVRIVFFICLVVLVAMSIFVWSTNRYSNYGKSFLFGGIFVIAYELFALLQMIRI